MSMTGQVVTKETVVKAIGNCQSLGKMQLISKRGLDRLSFGRWLRRVPLQCPSALAASQDIRHEAPK